MATIPEYDPRQIFQTLPLSPEDQEIAYTHVMHVFTMLGVPLERPEGRNILELATEDYINMKQTKTDWPPEFSACASVLQAALHILTAGSKSIDHTTIQTPKDYGKFTTPPTTTTVDSQKVGFIESDIRYRFIMQQCLSKNIPVLRAAFQRIDSNGNVLGEVRTFMVDGDAEKIDKNQITPHYTYDLTIQHLPPEEANNVEFPTYAPRPRRFGDSGGRRLPDVFSFNQLSPMQ